MKKSRVFHPNSERHLGIVQHRHQNDKRAMRSYHCGPFGFVPEHAPVVDLVVPRLALLLEFVKHPG